MLNKIIENMVKASSYFGDFLMHPRATTSRIFHDVTLGSIPERSKSGCDDECEFCTKLHRIEMGGNDES